MADYTPCPLDYCTLWEPHPHPAIGEGLFGPNQHQEGLRRGRGQAAGGLERVKIELTLVTVPCFCPRCGARFSGLQFKPLGVGEQERARVCDLCAEMSEPATRAAREGA